jgi:Reverse transcriptase (RNA-dependent DNA polymerase)
MIPKQAGFYGKPFRAKRGVRQGDIISPTIFNIIVDAVIREWSSNSDNNQHVEGIFYADDGLLISEDPPKVQQALDIFTDGFSRIGLKMNVVKTEVMVVKGEKVQNMISTEAYQRKTTGKGGTHRERSQEKNQCKLCGDLVSRQYLIKHQQTKKCKTTCKMYEHNVEEFEEESSDIESDIQKQ